MSMAFHRVRRRGVAFVATLGLLLALASSSVARAADVEVRGRVRDLAGSGIAGARLWLDGRAVASSDSAGEFSLVLPATGERHTLRVVAAGFAILERSLAAGEEDLEPKLELILELILEPALRVSEDLVVRALRAAPEAPVTQSELPAERLAALSYGQEMPFLLATTPGVTSYSESGLALGAGYSYFSLRGLPQSRINMTFDGVPLNDPEESAVYFANFGDFAAAVGSVEVQRGVGTSTFGSASYGGAISFGSVTLAEQPVVALELGGGSYGTTRASLRAESGRLASGLALYARYSDLDSDGYREHSGMHQRTLFLGGDWRGSESYVRFFGFKGREDSQLSYYAVEPWILASSPRFNPMRPDETDSFGQDVSYVQIGRRLADGGELAAQVSTSGASGSLFLWDDPAARSGRREAGIDGRAWSLQATGSFSGERWQLATGLLGTTFARDHFAAVDGVRQYENTGRKRELSGFAKLGLDLTSRWHLFADLQVRHARFAYDGAVDLEPVAWTFLNPKLGVRVALGERTGLYASVGRSKREPARNDLLAGEDDLSTAIDLGAVKPEEVVDWELGGDWRSEHLVLRGNLYAMEFDNEIAATGEQSELGYAIRRNLPRSHRRGVEIELAWQATERLMLRGQANLSRNRIDRWTQELDVYDEAGSFVGRERRTFTDTEPSLSPERILGASLEWRPWDPVTVELSTRWVGRAQLDNTGDRGLATEPYSWSDLALRLDLSSLVSAGAPRLRVQVGNLFDAERVWPSGYSYPYLLEDAAGTRTFAGVPYYYPLARRHAVVALELSF